MTARRLRIVFCIDNFNLGGTELNAVRTAERLDRSRFDLRVVALQEEGPLLERYRAAGVPVQPLPIPNLYGPGAWARGKQLVRFLREQRADVLHAHDKYSNMFAIPYARLAGVGTIASRRWWGGEARAGHRYLNRVSYRMSHAVLANSERVADMVVQREGVAAERVVTIRNFLDAEAFEPLPAELPRRFCEGLGIPGDARLVGIIANLRPVKDQASLLRAVASLAPRWPRLHLVLIGEGESRASLEALAGELGITDRVHFAGRHPNQPNLHGMFEISVLTSVSEGLSNSILEAMAAGRPVVATDVGGTADAVVDGETGILVPRSAPEALADALERLLSDPELGRRMGEAGRRRALERYSPDAALGRLGQLYEGLADRRSRRERVAALSLAFASGLE